MKSFFSLIFTAENTVSRASITLKTSSQKTASPTQYLIFPAAFLSICPILYARFRSPVSFFVSVKTARTRNRNRYLVSSTPYITLPNDYYFIAVINNMLMVNGSL